MNHPAPDAAAWDRYWAYGNLHSFSQVAPGNYAGPVADFWMRQFDRLGDDACLVDIATGNGAIALLALDAAERTGVTPAIHGTDLAAIDPAQQLADPESRARAARIRFHPRTAAEALPFAPASVDLACSQFGLEYSDLERSVAELGRVLTPGGRVALVMHHAHSGAVAAARAEAAQLAFVLDDARLYRHARQFLRALAELGGRRRAPRAKLPAKPAKKRTAMDRAIQRIRAAADARGDANAMRGALNYVDEVMGMTERVGPERALDWLAEAHGRITAMRARLDAMQRGALDAAAMDAFAARLDSAGLPAPAIETLVEGDDRLLGWTVEARRA